MASSQLRAYRAQCINRQMSIIMTTVAVKTANKMTTEEFFSGALLLKGK